MKSVRGTLIITPETKKKSISFLPGECNLTFVPALTKNYEPPTTLASASWDRSKKGLIQDARNEAGPVALNSILSKMRRLKRKDPPTTKATPT
jgi:hypothetical protein